MAVKMTPDGYIYITNNDAIQFKKMLEGDNPLESKLNQAVEDIRMLGRMGANICPVCAHYNHGEGDKRKCVSCIINRDTDNFEWRGMNHERAD